jgi:hypothetical protein
LTMVMGQILATPTPVNVTVQIAQGLSFGTPYFGSEASRTIAKNIAWDQSQYQLQSATLVIQASQTYLSGAQCQVYINNNLAISIGWGAFDNGTKQQSSDVTSSLLDGNNTFTIVYTTSFPSIGATLNVIDLSLNLTFLYIGTGQPGNPIGPPGGLTLSYLEIAFIVGTALGVGLIVAYLARR